MRTQNPKVQYQTNQRRVVQMCKNLVTTLTRSPKVITGNRHQVLGHTELFEIVHSVHFSIVENGIFCFSEELDYYDDVANEDSSGEGPIDCDDNAVSETPFLINTETEV